MLGPSLRQDPLPFPALASYHIMASISHINPVILFRRCSIGIQTPFRCYQRRWAQVHDVRFFAVHQRLSDKVLEKYRQKLDQKAREHGLKDVEELKDVYQDKIQELRKKAIVPGANAPLTAQPPPSPHEAAASIPFQPPPPPEPQTQTPVPQVPKSKDGIKTLDSFIDVEKTSALPAKEIEALWRLRHVRAPNSLCAVMPADTFQRIAATARAHPQFILPIPREAEGAEIHFLQWTFPSASTATVLFTHLAEFKVRGEFAQPHTTITYHLDMLESNGLVLLEGQVQDGKNVTVDEAKWLLMCLQKFYGFEATSESAKANAARRRKLMEQFSGGDETFKVEELLEEAEKVP
nr:protein atp11, mitochondrial [Quercus suber]